MVFSLVHISDFHFQNTYPCKSRLELLKSDILENTRGHPFYLAFTGDLVHSGDADHYGTLFDDFFAPLDEHARGIYLTPGNHDIQRANANSAQCNSLLQDRGLSYLYDHTGQLILGNPFSHNDPLSNYFTLQNILASFQECNFFGSISLEPHFCLVSVNSTWLSHSRKKGESDQGNLRVDPPALQHFIRLIPQDKIAICIMHHPLDWLDQVTRQLIEDLLTKNFDIALFGHNHIPSSIAGKFNAGSCLFLHSPAIFSSKSDGPNAYAIINIEPTEGMSRLLLKL